jgi:hypothetical protein
MPVAILVGLNYGALSVPFTVFVWNKSLRWAGLGGRTWFLTIRTGDSLVGRSTAGAPEHERWCKWHDEKGSVPQEKAAQCADAT